MKIKYERTAMYKNNSQDSSKFKVCSPLQLYCNLTGKYPAVGYYSYTNRSHQLNERYCNKLYYMN